MQEFQAAMFVILVIAVVFYLGKRIWGRGKKRDRRALNDARSVRRSGSSLVREPDKTLAPGFESEIPSEDPGPKPFDPEDDVRPVPAGQECVGPAYVIDGDSIVIKGTQIRLFGVDAPELNHPFGKQAKWALVRLCKGKEIRAELIAMDAHERTVAKCFLPDGRDLSAEMVKQGWAIDWPKFSGGVYACLEPRDARKKMWLADARQKGHMHVWKRFEERQAAKGANGS